MSVQLPADLEASIRQKVSSGRFGDEAEVVREALMLLDAREHERFTELRAKVEAGFASGEGALLTPELIDRLDAEADDMIRKGVQPNPDVCP